MTRHDTEARSGMRARALVRAVAGGLSLLALACLAACSAKQVPYGDEIQARRAEKDRFMREASDSPVPPEKRGSFPALAYFGTDPDYRVPASLEVRQSDSILEMPTSSGVKRQMRRIGTLKFTLKGQPLTLTAFVDATENDMRRLFVPFGDLTNGNETYQGGRYLDLDRTATGIYDLDFNRAYHPFCLYNPAYECPIPPRENRLTVPVRAGERLGAAAH
jgi:uncharacterized protein